MSLKNRVWTVVLVFAVVGSHFLKAAPFYYRNTLFSFALASDSDLMNGTQGFVRAVYGDAAMKKLVGFDYCHNFWGGMGPKTDLSAAQYPCGAVIPIAEFISGRKVIEIKTKVGYIGTALEIKAPSFDPVKGGEIQMILGYKMHLIGKNKYRIFRFDLSPNTKDILLPYYKGGYFGHIDLEGDASIISASGELETIQLNTGEAFGNRPITVRMSVADLEPNNN